ncbi:hypothetical protein GW17_00034083 [Ensete ventricosum]|nr:hypothetical protein GW17_00034083 [Ensete ventricosum]RZS00756.1 hypothetical protein BHM03_00030524 [Ensete ventricosum]
MLSPLALKKQVATSIIDELSPWFASATKAASRQVFKVILSWSPTRWRRIAKNQSQNPQIVRNNNSRQETELRHGSINEGKGKEPPAVACKKLGSANTSATRKEDSRRYGRIGDQPRKARKASDREWERAVGRDNHTPCSPNLTAPPKSCFRVFSTPSFESSPRLAPESATQEGARRRWRRVRRALNGAEGERNGRRQPRHVRWSRLVGPAEPRAWRPLRAPSMSCVGRRGIIASNTLGPDPRLPCVCPTEVGPSMLSNEKLGKFERCQARVWRELVDNDSAVRCNQV